MAVKIDMIPFASAFEITMRHVRLLDTERVDLAAVAGRVLAQDVFSDMDFPPFNKSAMDGFACRREDLGSELTVVETVPAGKPPTRTIGENECARIMTGAMVPQGASVVFMVEHSEIVGEERVRFTGRDTLDNICLRAEDVEEGTRVLSRGTRIGPAHVAVLASVGCAQPEVYLRPRVGIIATGDELVEPFTTPGPSQIRNSNSHQLVSHVDSTGAIPRYYGIAKDTPDAIDAVFKTAARESDVVLLSGGVSQGDFDLVPDILVQNGVDILYDRVAVKPGKPSTFGVSREAACFGLPGNPVSTFVIFELLVKPYLLGMMGHELSHPEVRLPLEQDLDRRKDEREEWLPVRITDTGSILPVRYHGSAHFLALSFSDGLIMMPAGTKHYERGTRLRVRLL